MIGCRMSSVCSRRSRSRTSALRAALVVATFVVAGCAHDGSVVLPAPGGAVPLSIDGELRMKGLDEITPRCVSVVRDLGGIHPGARLALLVPGGDADAAATSLTLASGLREAGYLVRRTHRRKLEAGETLVEVFPISDGAAQRDDGTVRAWRVHVDVRLFVKSDEPAFISDRLRFEASAPLPRNR